MTPAELIADIKQGFYVTDLIGSGVNGVTGDYSRGASGFWIENGEITYAVSEVTIAGHLFDMFKSLVPANDLEFRYGVNAPTLAHRGLDAWRPLMRATMCWRATRAADGGGARGGRARASRCSAPS